MNLGKLANSPFNTEKISGFFVLLNYVKISVFVGALVIIPAWQFQVKK